MKRIRYVKQPDGALVSMQIISTSVGDVRSLIFPNRTSGMIINASSSKGMCDVLTATSEHKIKIKLKNKLTASFGVVFDGESRSIDEADEVTTS